MKLDFRIDFGYQYLYSRRHYHPLFIWDGSLDCEGGKIKDSYTLEYPYQWWGITETAKETKLKKPEWKLETKRAMRGVRIIAEIDEKEAAKTVFHLRTASVNVDFIAEDVIKKGRIDFPVGPKYLACRCMVTRTGYYWHQPEPKTYETSLKADALRLPVHDWARMHLAWLAPGKSVSWELDVPEPKKDYFETLIHLVAMAVPEYDPKQESIVQGIMPFEIYCDGKKIKEYKRYYTHHDDAIQMLEDEWQRVKLEPGHHKLKIKNCDPELSLGIDRITTQPVEYDHGQLTVPEWALINEKLTAFVFAVREDRFEISWGGKKIRLDAVPGWNEFAFASAKAGNVTVKAVDSNKNVHKSNAIEVFDVAEEKEPVRVGYDMTAVPHDANGLMDWLLDYTHRTRLGNYVVFRNFGMTDVEPELLTKWGEYCRDHGIYVAACTDYLGGELAEAAGDMFSDCGLHEYPGRVYAFDPEKPWASKNMEEAANHYMDFLKLEIDKAHAVADCTAFGDASGGIRYSYMAGVDFVRAETMVGPTMPLLSQVRPASEIFGNGRWGVHIAIQHHYFPYKETQLGQYFLSLFQPWMMGCNTLYEEDSLFIMLKEERHAWDDVLTKGKRDMTRSFFKFAKTHPRSGKNVRNIAFIDGRWAAPFNSFICGTEQDPHYAVWGLFGNNAPEWGHGQPEKAHQVLDVLMPGTSTHPLRQRFDKWRPFFAGTPFGDFDCVPIEAEAEYFDQYKLMLNLGWNTMIDVDYKKLKAYVENGGVLLTGIPQFSTHTERKFLKNMKDLALYKNGDLTEMCGIKVNGRGQAYSGQWCSALRDEIPEPELSAIPSDCAEEDGPAYLADVELKGAEVIAWDAFSGKPMLVRKQLGKGYVYTFTAWVYPGHEKLQHFSAAWLSRLAGETLGDVYVTDESKEVFWTVWEDKGIKKVMMLNTDWTVKGNVKTVKLHYGNKVMDVDITERTAVIAVCAGGSIAVEEFTL